MEQAMPSRCAFRDRLALLLTEASLGLLDELDFGYCSLGWEEATAIAEVLRTPGNNVTSVDLHDNSCQDKGCIAIAEALKHPNNKVRWLNLVQNHIGNAGCLALAEALQHPNNRVTQLYFGLNDVDNEGTIVLAQALKAATNKVNQLYLGWNHMGDDGAAAVSDALVHPNNKLTELCLMYGGISSAFPLADALRAPNCRLKVLKLDGNPIGPLGAQAIVTRAKTSCLSHLEVKNDLGLDPPQLEAIKHFSTGLSSQWFKTLIVLMTAKTVPRLAGPQYYSAVLQKDGSSLPLVASATTPVDGDGQAERLPRTERCVA